MKTQRIEIYGIDLQVGFYFQKGLPAIDDFSPDDPDELEIEEILLEGVDIKDLLSRTVMAQIKSEIHSVQA